MIRGLGRETPPGKRPSDVGRCVIHRCRLAGVKIGAGSSTVNASLPGGREVFGMMGTTVETTCLTKDDVMKKLIIRASDGLVLKVYARI
ncbi:MAG: hypothetical protein HYV46_13525 [candidate division NC10 bacterium]|nr:hypothetical protein [candidate division NC10 bacterium]